jgi:multiple sugar transport system substrate-binding protein
MGKKRCYRFTSFTSKTSKYWYLVIAIATIWLSIACSPVSPPTPKTITQSPSATKELIIWWEQGFNLEEDEAMRTVVNNWQKQTGNQVQLSFFTNDELTAKTERAVVAGHPPDIMMNQKAENILYPRLAWQGKLESVADLIEPVKTSYNKNILQSITYYNAEENRSDYYGVPVYQTTILIYYWQKLLASIGLSSQDIPQDWDSFWQFWQQAQVELKAKQNKDIYGLGFSLSEDKIADDTHFLFEQILEAYDVALFDSNHHLNIENSQVRQKLINCLAWYARLYYEGYIPPDAVQWSNVDNNRSLLNRLVLMTPNPSLSIPATVRQDEDTYYNKLGVTGFPNKPSGKPMRYLVSIRQGVIFRDSLHKSLAKEFLSYFIQPQVTTNYLQASGNRNQPVHNNVWSDPLWQNSPDPYVVTITKVLTTKNTRLSYTVQHPAYSQVLAENIWGQALTAVTLNQMSPEVAADRAIARIKEIFAEWK